MSKHLDLLAVSNTNLLKYDSIRSGTGRLPIAINQNCASKKITSTLTQANEL